MKKNFRKNVDEDLWKIVINEGKFGLMFNFKKTMYMRN